MGVLLSFIIRQPENLFYIQDNLICVVLINGSSLRPRCITPAFILIIPYIHIVFGHLYIPMLRNNICYTMLSCSHNINLDNNNKMRTKNKLEKYFAGRIQEIYYNMNYRRKLKLLSLHKQNVYKNKA